MLLYQFHSLHPTTEANINAFQYSLHSPLNGKALWDTKPNSTNTLSAWLSFAKNCDYVVFTSALKSKTWSQIPFPLYTASIWCCTLSTAYKLLTSCFVLLLLFLEKKREKYPRSTGIDKRGRKKLETLLEGHMHIKPLYKFQHKIDATYSVRPSHNGTTGALYTYRA